MCLTNSKRTKKNLTKLSNQTEKLANSKKFRHTIDDCVKFE